MFELLIPSDIAGIIIDKCGKGYPIVVLSHTEVSQKQGELVAMMKKVHSTLSKHKKRDGKKLHTLR